MRTKFIPNYLWNTDRGHKAKVNVSYKIIILTEIQNDDQAREAEDSLSENDIINVTH
jgi:hypothetical protein